MIFKILHASSTFRVSGPTCAKVGVADTGYTGTLPKLALIPKRPVNEAGILTEPPPSVPKAYGTIPAATIAAAPQLDPPGVRSKFHGFLVIPVKGLSPTALHPNSLVVDLPSNTAPEFLSLSTDGASTSQFLSGVVFDPNLKGKCF